MNYVTGIDLSLTATGICAVSLELATPDWYTLTAKPPKRLGDVARLDWIVEQVVQHCPAVGLVVVEGPAYGAQGSAYHQLAGLWWIVRRELHRQLPGCEAAIAPPAAVKKIATGKGNANKDEVLLATAKRFSRFDGDNNAADALWLATLGATRLGRPLAELPQHNLNALEGVTWPETLGAQQ